MSYNVTPYALELQNLYPGILKKLRTKQPPQLLKAVNLEHYDVYTNGSKADDGEGYAMALLNRKIAKRASPFSSIYTAELKAILTAIAYFLRVDKGSFVIFSDSKSVLQSICDPCAIYPVVTQIHL